jgi:hypothetical protein
MPVSCLQWAVPLLQNRWLQGEPYPPRRWAWELLIGAVGSNESGVTAAAATKYKRRKTFCIAPSPFAGFEGMAPDEEGGMFWELHGNAKLYMVSL